LGLFRQKFFNFVHETKTPPQRAKKHSAIIICNLL
jgi:hypothetical protein